MNPCLIYIHYLKRLIDIVEKSVEYCGDSETLWNARLYEDMLPFARQVKTAIGFSLRSCCPLADLEIQSFENPEDSLTSIKQQTLETINYLKSISNSFVEPYKETNIVTKAGFAELELPSEVYLHLYSLPNFFFHLGMAYAIARNRGVPLGKGDFDGFHEYPTRFSFSENQ